MKGRGRSWETERYPLPLWSAVSCADVCSHALGPLLSRAIACRFLPGQLTLLLVIRLMKNHTARPGRCGLVGCPINQKKGWARA